MLMLWSFDGHLLGVHRCKLGGTLQAVQSAMHFSQHLRFVNDSAIVSTLCCVCVCVFC
jgi:hypothetical protein